ncbi:HDOD domain-containing protein [Comamonas endophytica]|uniref:HDOD domain-containing protein n=1 Tax=Comamonas endophytica TaxID=2949090 RepID=A0ABY6GAP6_9BURK|nr:MULTISPECIES: HDOD domain-containing protein [unclassified Acidovorax]MCD2511731.1 HDOD domain-containing protein [Acidovorax sp. D4N7]UYG51457.1 HDOD domain-containing protein [Acidovorax sp. 5MLIR]
MDPKDLLATPPALPSLPRAVALLSAELAAPAPRLRRLAQLFATDPQLAAQLLREANAPLYQLPGRIGGIAEALVVVAPARLQSLVAAARRGGGARAVPGIDLAQFWRYSLETARMARALAAMVRYSPSHAYAAGLVHALGLCVIHLRAPQQAAALQVRCAPLAPERAFEEQAAWGLNHAQVTAALARQWHWPAALADGLAQMHQPLQGAASEPLAGLLHLAVWRARAGLAALGERELAVSFPAETALALGLDIDMVLQQEPIDWSQPGMQAEAH